MRGNLLAACLLASTLTAQDTGELENPIPDLFAGLNALMLSDELSAASLRVENPGPSEDTRLDTFRIPWNTTVALGESGEALRLDAALGAMRARDVLRLDTSSGLAVVRQTWTLVGFELRAGLERPVGAGFLLRPTVSGGLSWLENKADYNAVAEIEIEPFIEGVVVNWDGFARSLSGGLALERPRARGQLDWGLETRGVASRVRVFEASSRSQEGADTSALGLLRAELGAPLGGPAATLSAWDLGLAAIQLGGMDEATLGFDSFLELGGGLEFRLSERLPSLRLGLAWIVGDGVRGYSFGLGFAP